MPPFVLCARSRLHPQSITVSRAAPGHRSRLIVLTPAVPSVAGPFPEALEVVAPAGRAGFETASRHAAVRARDKDGNPPGSFEVRRV